MKKKMGYTPGGGKEPPKREWGFVSVYVNK